MFELVNLNGQLVPGAPAQVSLFNHGLLYGDGLFETLRVDSGRLCWLERHLDRLEDSAARIRLALPASRDALAQAMQETVTANGAQDAALRLTLTRGEGPPVPNPAQCGPATFFITLRERPAQAASVRACLEGEHPRAFIPGIKSLSYQPFVLARAAARDRGYDEALLSTGPNVVEGSTTSLFMVLDGELRTPGLSSGCLPGIMRGVILDLARNLGLRVRERTLAREELFAAAEVFLTSSLAGIVPVAEVESCVLPAPGPITRRLMEALPTGCE